MHPHDHPHEHEHEHEHGGAPGRPTADASVRRARASDAPAIGQVQAAVFEAAYRPVVDPEVSFDPHELARVWRAALQTPPPGAVALVACAGEQVVGYAALGPCPDPDAGPGWVEILGAGVHPRARGQGHGSRLLQAGVDTARGAGGELLVTWVLAVHEDVRAFLQLAGFDPDTARRERVVGADGRTVREVRLVVAVPAATG